MKDVIVITGPTASGKTGVSIELSKKINAEIINADSMQIFKGLDIGTAKPSERQLAEIKHHLIDITEPDREFSVASYKEAAHRTIRDILARKKKVVITGGTGMYIDALVNNLDFALDKYNELLKKTSPEEIHSILVQRDPVAAKSVHPNNVRRVIRYLEILEGFDGTLEEYKIQTRSKPVEFNYHIQVLWPEREFLYKRIEKRVDDMISDGLVDEVKQLQEMGINASMQSMQGIGYKETISYLDGKIEYKEFVELLKRNTRRYAKRQYTWMGRYSNENRFYIDKNTKITEIVEKIQQSLGL